MSSKGLHNTGGGRELPPWRINIPDRPPNRDTTVGHGQNTIPVADIMSAIESDDLERHLDNLKQLTIARQQIEEALTAQEQQSESGASPNATHAHLDYFASLTLLSLSRMKELLVRRQSEGRDDQSAEAVSVEEYRAQMIAVEDQSRKGVAIHGEADETIQGVAKQTGDDGLDIHKDGTGARYHSHGAGFRS